MERIAFKMTLFRGAEAEYERRHQELWPELEQLFNKVGINDYSIFLDADSNLLFASLKIPDRKLLDALADEPAMQRWWQYMKELMASNADGSPVTTPLKEVFYFP